MLDKSLGSIGFSPPGVQFCAKLFGWTVEASGFLANQHCLQILSSNLRVHTKAMVNPQVFGFGPTALVRSPTNMTPARPFNRECLFTPPPTDATADGQNPASTGMDEPPMNTKINNLPSGGAWRGFVHPHHVATNLTGNF